MPTIITIELDITQVQALRIHGPCRITMPGTGYLSEHLYEIQHGTTLERLRTHAERREAVTNKAQLRMQHLQEPSND